ncbi:MAG: AMP-binding protein [Candidatus Riflebacteria bacterium]|nr:AMP-binding protein [Candidatus Riflebacteria bacterium]
MKNKFFVFGEIIEENPLTPDFVSSILKKAENCKNIFEKVSIDEILNILDEVSKIWADKSHLLTKTALEQLPGIINFSSEMVQIGIQAVSEICKKENLQRRLEGEIGDFRKLDGWVFDHKTEIEIKARPQGILLHLSAGNVFVGAIDSLISGIITKNVNIVKMSSADPIFPILFMESLRECDKKGQIWPHQCLVNWKGGTEEVEKPFLHSDITVVFWGGKDALKSIKEKSGENIKLVENGPRFSFAIGDSVSLNIPGSTQAICGLASDIAMWDQQACSSPHLVYLVNTDRETTTKFITNLQIELENLSRTLPVGKLSFDEKVEIRKIRELSTMAEIHNSAEVFAPEAFDFTIIREQNPGFKISCLNRVFFVKNIESIEELREHILPISSFLQTVGIFLSSNNQEIAFPLLEQLGVKRITEWGGMSLGRSGAPHEGAFFLSKLVEFIDHEPLNYPQYRLSRLIQELRKSTFYSKTLQNIPPKTLVKDIISAFPLLDRETFYKNSPPLSNDILTVKPGNGYVFASGGTTGSPKYSFYSNPEFVKTAEQLALILSSGGLQKEDIVGNLFLAGNLWMSFTISNRALELLGCLNLPISANSSIENIFHYLQAFQVTAIIGIPSMILKVAEEAKRRNINLRIKKILYGGEHLRPAMVDFLKEVFQSEIIRSAGYACVDTSAIGYQCLHLEGSSHHVLEETQYVEILNSDGVPCKPEEPGEIIVTNLYRFLMPIVRYKTGDLGKWISISNCPCGFKGPTFELLGRCDDLMVIGGINLTPNDVSKGLTSLGVQFFQIIGKSRPSKDLLCLKLESERAISLSEVKKSLMENSYKIKEALEEGWLELEIECLSPGKIERNERTGKIKVVIDERKTK